MHEYYPDGGQSIRWLTDEEFAPYDDSSVEEDSHVGGPSCVGREARRHISASRRLAMQHLQAAKDTIVDDEFASVTYSKGTKEGTPEV